MIIAVGVHVDEDYIQKDCEKIGQKFVNLITENINSRFSDDVSQLCSLQDILKEKPVFFLLETICLTYQKLSLWVNGNSFGGCLLIFQPKREMVALVTSADKKVMFPFFAAAIKHLLLLPIGTEFYVTNDVD